MFAITLLAAASGYPNQITESALQAWLRDSHVSLTMVGVMSYVSLPYLLKVFWAPLVDRFPVPILGRRRGWILIMQLGLAATIALLATQSPTRGLAAIAIVATAIVFCSATQDIAIDAYRTDVSAPEERGLAAAAANLGYRTMSWIVSAAALVFADWLGWRVSFTILAVGIALFSFATWYAPEPRYTHAPPRTLEESVLEPLRELFGVPGMALLILLVLLFKVGDAFSNKLFTPFMMDVGYSKLEIGVIVKAFFTTGVVIGSILGGVLMVRLGLLKSMLAFGILQALTNLLYCLVAVAGKNYPIMVFAVSVEHIAGAMGQTALVALIMAMCDRRFSAFQYALLSAIATLPRYGLGGPAGWIAEHAGWYTYYVVSFAIALPGLAMVWAMRRRIEAVDSLRT